MSLYHSPYVLCVAQIKSGINLQELNKKHLAQPQSLIELYKKDSSHGREIR